MRFSEATVLVTGGGTGIGRGLAEAFHARGAQVIVAGRREGPLSEVVAANPGMGSMILDVSDPASIEAAVPLLIAEYPELNMVINAAGVASRDEPEGVIDDAVLTATIATNLMGPIRLTSALMHHLRGRTSAAVIHVSSCLAYVPHAQLAIYSATKAALHSYALSQRYRLKGTAVAVVEIAPPMVATALDDNAHNPQAMPLDAYIAETMEALESGVAEALVTQAKQRRDTLRPGELQATDQFNEMLVGVG